MLTKEFCILNNHGLHARPASLFCDKALKFNSDIKVFKGGFEADGKSVVSILMLEVNYGANIKIQIEGPDEAEAMQALAQLIDNNFGE